MRVLMLEYWNSGAQRLHKGDIVEVNDGVGTALILTRRAIAADVAAVRECAAILEGSRTAPAANTSPTGRAMTASEADLVRKLRRGRHTTPPLLAPFIIK